jgi:hypothetical protein
VLTSLDSFFCLIKSSHDADMNTLSSIFILSLVMFSVSTFLVGKMFYFQPESG